MKIEDQIQINFIFLLSNQSIQESSSQTRIWEVSYFGEHMVWAVILSWDQVG